MEYKVTNEQINEYISGELTGSNLIEFEKLLASDEALQKQIKVHQQIDTILSENYFEVNRFNQEEHQNEKERLNPIFNKMNKKYFTEEDAGEKKISIPETKVNEEKTLTDESNNTPVIRRLLPFVTLAAAAALLLFVFNLFVNNLSPTQLADQYYVPITANSIRGDLDNNTATKTPRELLAQGSQQYDAGQIEEAIQSFQQVETTSSLNYQNKANWYLALCYLKLNQPEKAKPILIKLKAAKNHSEDAKSILKQLE